jgi:CRISPR/Cas system endoribonuclease Cas6 (RAMP superfamily)
MRLHWHEWTRFSSRQDTRMQMGGLLGDLTLGGPGLPTFWSSLWYGQWVHVGKGTSFGLGAYALDPS